MKNLLLSDLTIDFKECTLTNALQLCKDCEIESECSHESFLLITFANGLQIGIQNGGEPVPFSEVTPDLNYDPPHVFLRVIQQTKKAQEETARQPTMQKNVPFYNNELGKDS
jgi:hypothetical protein